MTPAVKVLGKHNVPHQILEYDHDSGADSYGLEASEKLGIDPHLVFKTLVVLVDKRALAVALVPVNGRLDLKAIAKATGGKKAEMAPPADVQKSTGYVLGGVSPIGQKRRLPTFIDRSAQALDTVYVSGGKRGLEIALAPEHLAEMTQAKYRPLIATS